MINWLRSFRAQVVVLTLARAVLNTAHRMVYPFLPEFSRGTGLSLEVYTGLLSARSALGVTAPLFGGLSGRLGSRRAVLLGVAIFCAAMLMVGLWPAATTFALGVLLVISAKFVYDPALQAYLGERTPYAQRGFVIAFSELAWSAAALAGIPLAGLLMARGGWPAPYLPLAAAGGLAALALWRALPGQATAAGSVDEPAARWGDVWRQPAVLAGWGLGLLISGGNEVLTVVYGGWLEQAFGLKVAERGLTLIVIGLAELVGEGLVMGVADRLGKRLAIGLGLALSVLAYLALPLVAVRVEWALAGLFMVFVAFEFTIVATLPLMTELVPAARGAVMSGNMAAHAGGRMFGALLGGWLFRRGFQWNGASAAGLNLVALALLWLAVREARPAGTPTRPG